MLELLYHNRNHLITTIVDGSICTRCLGGPFGINCPSAFLKIWKFSNILRVVYRKNCLNQKSGYWLITSNTLHRT